MKPVPTIADRLRMIDAIRSRPAGGPLPLPAYASSQREGRVFCAVETFARHMTDEGWQLQSGLERAGYKLAGRYFDFDEVDVRRIVADMRPGVCIVQDKREWDATRDGCFDKSIAFEHSSCLREHPEIFKLTVIKDAHSDPPYHREAADEIGCHAWIAYYHPEIVCHLAPWVRREHVIRTWHSLNPADVPAYSTSGREGCLLSGATNRQLYPFRERLKANCTNLPGVSYLQHPGYHARGWQTPRFLRQLAKFKVAICTASVFGYALRKIVESVACGCVVITDLPPDEVLPAIDGALIRVSPEIGLEELGHIIRRAESEYDPMAQEDWSKKAVAWYDWQRRGAELAVDIEVMRGAWPIHRAYDRTFE